MDLDSVGNSLGGGAAVAGALALARLVVEHVGRRGQRAVDQEQRCRAHEWDAEARLQRVLADQLAEAEHRFERCAAELERERVSRGELEPSYLCLEQTQACLSGGRATHERAAGGSRVQRCPPRRARLLLLGREQAVLRRRYARLQQSYARLEAEHRLLLER